MSLSNHPAVPAELNAVRARGRTRSRAAGTVMSLVVGVKDSGMKAADPFYSNFGACGGLYVFRSGAVVAVCHIPGGAWSGELDVMVLVIGEVGRDGSKAQICAIAQGRKP